MDRSAANLHAIARALVAVTLAAVSATAAVAQSVPATPKRQTPDAYPPPIPARKGPTPPSMTFRQISEIPLPGPLSTEATRLEDGTVRLPVSGGWAVVDLQPELGVRISSTDPREQLGDGRLRPASVVSPDGRYRYTTLAEGEVLAECHRKKGWRKAWRLRVPAATPAPPLLAGERLFFGSLDNQIYAVRSRNGHRLWASDAGGRISHPLTLWTRGPGEIGSSGAPPMSVELVLLVPDDGSSLMAFDTYDGSRIATLELPEGEEHRIVPPALTTGDGKIVVAIQRYAPEDAALIVYELVAHDDEQAQDRVAYNESDRPERDTPD